jgi:hypothetical protein
MPRFDQLVGAHFARAGQMQLKNWLPYESVRHLESVSDETAGAWLHAVQATVKS